MPAPAVKRDWVTTAVFDLMLIAGSYVAFESDEPALVAAWVLMLFVYVVAMACFLPSGGPILRALSAPLWVFGVYFSIAGCVGLFGWRRRRDEANL